MSIHLFRLFRNDGGPGILIHELYFLFYFNKTIMPASDIPMSGIMVFVLIRFCRSPVPKILFRKIIFTFYFNYNMMVLQGISIKNETSSF